ncbi:hypothetical protein [Streptomyces sp. NPDC126499]|uniref:hypothetical protein n=1 Tax=Streptomyces sp. NPDC126499 TaxID=3155314 RepID=UPI00333137B5
MPSALLTCRLLCLRTGPHRPPPARTVRQVVRGWKVASPARRMPTRRPGPTRSGLGFVEAPVYILPAVTALLAAPAVHRLERRFPYGLPPALLGLGLFTRHELVGLPDRARITDAVTVFWLFALGWAAARARNLPHRLVVTAVAPATVPGFFPGEPRRELFVMAGFCLLVWFPTLPSVRRVNQLAGLLAGSSLAIYLTQ